MEVVMSVTLVKGVDGSARCQANVKSEGSGAMKLCGKKLDPVFLAIVCRCEKSFCAKHRDVVAHECPVKEQKAAGVGKRYFSGGTSKNLDQAF
jgi:hypothetical protein